MTLAKASVLHLIVELLYAGRAEFIPELQSLEPIDVNSLVAELQSRTSQQFGKEAKAWVDWFVSSQSEFESQKSVLRSIYEFKALQDPIIERLNRRNGSPPADK